MKSHCPPLVRNWGDAKSKAPGDTPRPPPDNGQGGCHRPFSGQGAGEGGPSPEGGSCQSQPRTETAPRHFPFFFLKNKLHRHLSQGPSIPPSGMSASKGKRMSPDAERINRAQHSFPRVVPHPGKGPSAHQVAAGEAQ